MKEKVIFMGFYYDECKMQRTQIYIQGILRDSPEKTKQCRKSSVDESSTGMSKKTIPRKGFWRR